ncbi:MAG TPA: hypothetical protein VNK03_02685, partial [Gammaproteobacteria bacterium]|nr:hypothetical protein [Gammaproteobacteria bacterium]
MPILTDIQAQHAAAAGAGGLTRAQWHTIITDAGTLLEGLAFAAQHGTYADNLVTILQEVLCDDTVIQAVLGNVNLGGAGITLVCQHAHASDASLAMAVPLAAAGDIDLIIANANA